MQINIGDKVTCHRLPEYQNEDPVYYEVIDMWECKVMGTWLKLKHPEIAGHFTKTIDSVEEVFYGEG